MNFHVGGTSRIEMTVSGSRIETHPRPIPSARAAKEGVDSHHCGKVDRLRHRKSAKPMPLCGGSIGEDSKLTRRVVEACKFQSCIQCRFLIGLGFKCSGIASFKAFSDRFSA